MSIKRTIYVFVFFISLFVFSMDYHSRSAMEYNKINNLPDMISENEGEKIVQLEFDKQSPEFYDELVAYVKSQSQTILIARSTQNSDLSINQNYYIYTTDASKTLSNVYLKSTQTINFTNNNKEYYSSDINEDSINHIDYLNANYHKKYNHLIRIYPFEQIKRDQDKNQTLFLYVYTDDETKTMNDLFASNLATFISDDWKNNHYEPIEQEEYNDELPIKLLIVCAITVLLLTICEMIHKKKEIVIRKMFGMSHGYIWMKLFAPQLLISTLFYIIAGLIGYTVFIGHIRQVTHTFITSQMRYFSLFLLLQVILYVIVYIFIIKIRNVNHIKKEGALKNIAYANVLLKIVVVIFIMMPLINFVKLGISEIKSAQFLIANKEELKNQVFISGIRDIDGLDSMTSADELKVYFNEKGAIYQDFFANTLDDQNLEDAQYQRNLKPYLIVNKNYLADYKLKDANGDTIDVKNIQDNTLLIPEKYRQESMTKYCDVRECSSIMIENGMTYKNKDPMTALDNLYFKKDAIVLVKDITDSSCRWSYPYLLLKTEDIASIRAELKEKGLLEAVDLESTNSRYDLVFEEIKDNCLYLLSLLVVYGVVVLTFLYQTIFLYFESSKERFALRYLFGNSFFERHGEMIIINLSAYLLPLLYGWFIWNVSIQELLVFLSIAILFEVLASLLLIRVFEKNKITAILKGE